MATLLTAALLCSILAALIRAASPGTRARTAVLPIGTLLLAAACGGDPDPAIGDQSFAPPSGLMSAPSMADTVMGPGAGPRHTLHAHSTFNVRAKPSTTSRVVRTLRRGDTVSVGEAKDGWSPVIENGDRIGYVSRAGEALRSYAPTIPSPQVATYFNDGSGSARRAGSSRGTSRRSSAESRGYYTGPRGGCYTYSASGRKRYVDHSYCN